MQCAIFSYEPMMRQWSNEESKPEIAACLHILFDQAGSMPTSDCRTLVMIYHSWSFNTRYWLVGYVSGAIDAQRSAFVPLQQYHGT